jgi:hypothetical protein
MSEDFAAEYAEYERRHANEWIMICRWVQLGRRSWMVLAHKPATKERKHFIVPQKAFDDWKAPDKDLKCTQWFIVDPARAREIKSAGVQC